MTENTLKLIKYFSISIICITTILLIFMYVQMFKVKEFTTQLDNQLNEMTKKEEQINKYKENLIKNKDKIIEDYLRKDLLMVKENETLIKY